MRNDTGILSCFSRPRSIAHRAAAQRSRGLVAALTVLGATSRAAAQDTTAEIARRELIAQAERAADANDHPRALELATRAGAIRMTTSLRALIAYEQESVGRYVESLDSATLCVREATADTAMHHRAQMIQRCQQLATSLASRVGRVTLRVPSSAPAGLAVTLCGRAVASSLWALPLPVLPGACRVSATDGDRTAEVSVDVAAGATREVDVPLPPPAPAVVVTPRPVVTPQPVVAVAPVVTPPPPAPIQPPREPPPPRPINVGPWIVGGFGVAAFAMAGVFFGLRQGARSDRDALCDAAGCAAEAVDLNDRARQMTELTNISIAVGGLSIASAVVWWIIDRPRESARVAFDVRPTAGGAAVVVGGSL